jgi:glycosyltransferase involved in cell wall biosynthesis
MDRILIISYFYAPINNARAFRWSAIAEHWVRKGHHVDVISVWMPALQREEILNGVHVYRVGGTITEGLRSQLKKSVNLSTSTKSGSYSLTGLTGSATSIIKTLVKGIHDHTWKNLFWPDYACLWYFPALKKAKQLLKKHHYDSLISVSVPFTGHLVGLSIKKVLPQIPWLVDIGDPFCFIEYLPTNNHRFYKNLNYATENKIFRNAESVSVTTKATLEKYTSLFSESATKIFIIPQLMSLDTKPKIKGAVFPKDGKIRLVFAGRLYSEIRKPDFILRLFKHLLNTHLSDRLELHFFGNINDCQGYFEPYQVLLGKKIYCHGIVSRENVLQAMKEADVLVNIGNESPYELPSKVVEYATLGKPVLNISKIDNDSSTAFFQAYPGALCLLENEALSDSDHVVKLVKFIEHLPHIEELKLQDWLAPYQIEEIARAYELLLKKGSQ